MSSPHPEPTQPEDRLFEQLAHCLEAEGQVPDAVCARMMTQYPEFAHELREFVDGQACLHRIAQPLRPVAAAAQAASDADDPTHARLPRSLPELADYEIIEEVARGGMGIIYKARQRSLGRIVALKLLPFAATFDARQLQRFKNEAQAAALLHHTHIVPIYAVGCERGVHFYAMEFIEGQSLAAVIRQLRDQPEAKLPGLGPSTVNVSAALTTGTSAASEGYFRRIVRLMIQAAFALEHAHQRGVVHRDVKPANLLMDGSCNLWITDFGLAQFQADTGLTRTGDVLGTLRYMSPEQTCGRRAVLDHRTDIYSLGATFYELLTLRPVFEGETRQELLFQILHHDPRQPRQLNRSIPTELETILLKCLSKGPAERYDTAAELAADLQRFLDHQPIRARRPSLVDRARKWSRRHPSVVVASVLLLAVVAVSLLINNRMISREQQKTVAALERVSQEERRSTVALHRERSRANESAAQLQQARQTVDVLIQVGEMELAKEPVAPALRLLMLETSLDYYRNFIEQHRSDRASQPDLAATATRVQHMLADCTVVKEELLILEQLLAMAMLSSPTVLDEIGLSDEERDLVATFRQNWTSERLATLQELQTIHDMDVRRRRLFHLAEKYLMQCADVLSAEQGARLGQIASRANTMFGVAGSAAVEVLRLPPESGAAFGGNEFRTFGGKRELAAYGHRERAAAETTESTLEDAVAAILSLTSMPLRKSLGSPVRGFEHVPDSITRH
ncbi:MAG: serine/threonine-protein kinase [Planctomycetaceae bacterium]